MSALPLRDRASKVERLQEARAAGDRLARLMADPAVETFFAGVERRLTSAMIEAGPGDDEARRDAALQIAALRRLRTFLAHAIETGRHASGKLEEMRGTNA